MPGHRRALVRALLAYPAPVSRSAHEPPLRLGNEMPTAPDLELQVLTGFAQDRTRLGGGPLRQLQEEVPSVRWQSGREFGRLA